MRVGATAKQLVRVQSLNVRLDGVVVCFLRVKLLNVRDEPGDAKDFVLVQCRYGHSL